MNWYYLNGQTCHGPVTENDLLTLFERGKIEENTLISRDRAGNWVSLKSQFGRICEEKMGGLADSDPTSPHANSTPSMSFRVIEAGRVVAGDFFRMGSAVCLWCRLLFTRHVKLNLAFIDYGRFCRDSGVDHLVEGETGAFGNSQMPGADASPKVDAEEIGHGHPWWIQVRTRFRLAMRWLREQIALIDLGKAAFAEATEMAEKPPGLERISKVKLEIIGLEQRLQSVTANLHWIENGRPTLHLASASLLGLVAICLILITASIHTRHQDHEEGSALHTEQDKEEIVSIGKSNRDSINDHLDPSQKTIPSETVEQKAKEARKRALAGDADAQYELSYFYYFGEGVPQDYEECAKWAKMAADQGHLEACSALGDLYNEGKGVTKSLDRSIFWYRKAADKGDNSAQFRLAMALRIQSLDRNTKEYDDFRKEALRLLRQSAVSGNGNAMFELGEENRLGTKAVHERDENEGTNYAMAYFLFAEAEKASNTTKERKQMATSRKEWVGSKMNIAERALANEYSNLWRKGKDHREALVGLSE